MTGANLKYSSTVSVGKKHTSEILYFQKSTLEIHALKQDANPKEKTRSYLLKITTIQETSLCPTRIYFLSFWLFVHFYQPWSHRHLFSSDFGLPYLSLGQTHSPSLFSTNSRPCYFVFSSLCSFFWSFYWSIYFWLPMVARATLPPAWPSYLILVLFLKEQTELGLKKKIERERIKRCNYFYSKKPLTKLYTKWFFSWKHHRIN